MAGGSLADYAQEIRCFLFPAYQKARACSRSFAGELGTLLQEISNIKLPFTIFTPEEKVQIVLAEMNGDNAKLDSIYNASAKRFKKQYKVK